MATITEHQRRHTRPQALMMFCIRGYQLVISPLMGSHCRFYPCCSNYAMAAIETHGCLRGAWLAGKRILRCHPYCAGGHDPVPPRPHPTQK